MALGWCQPGRQSPRALRGVQEVGFPAGLLQTALVPCPGQGQPPQLQPRLLQKPGGRRGKKTLLHPHRPPPSPSSPTSQGSTGTCTPSSQPPTAKPRSLQRCKSSWRYQDRRPQTKGVPLHTQLAKDPRTVTRCRRCLSHVVLSRLALASPLQGYVPREQHPGLGAALHPGVPTTVSICLGKAGLRHGVKLHGKKGLRGRHT